MLGRGTRVLIKVIYIYIFNMFSVNIITVNSLHIFKKLYSDCLIQCVDLTSDTKLSLQNSL